MPNHPQDLTEFKKAAYTDLALVSGTTAAHHIARFGLEEEEHLTDPARLTTHLALSAASVAATAYFVSKAKNTENQESLKDTQKNIYGGIAAVSGIMAAH